MRLDLKISPQRCTWDEFTTAALEGEASNLFTGLWAFDHLAPVSTGGGSEADPDSCFEGWTTIAALAAITERCRLGLLVTSVLYRNVGVLAQMAATVDHISGGRLEIGLGAGNNPAESRSVGLPFPSPGGRTTLLDEYVSVLNHLLSGETTTFEGGFVNVRDAKCSPRPLQQRVPVVIGGKGEQRTLRTTATHADGWNYSQGSPEEFAHKLSVLRAHAAAAGRDPAELRASVQVRVSAATVNASAMSARAYVDAGATDIVLYVNARGDQLGAALAVAERLRD